MASQLQVDTEKYLRERIEECTKLDMNENPEVNHITDFDKRKKQADKWLESRLNQLNRLESFARLELNKAYERGYLEGMNLFHAKEKFHKAYEWVRNQAKEKYVEAINIDKK